MIVAVLAVLVVFISPLWEIKLKAPQYPNDLKIFIWVNKIKGEDESLKNINIMNHYVGMQEIKPESIPELKIFPYVIILMSLFGFIIAFKGNKTAYISWVVVMGILGILGMYDFYLWEYDYGHNLSDTAALKVKPMQLPLIGTKKILNFQVSSLPHIGAYFLTAGIGIAALATIFKIKEKKA